MQMNTMLKIGSLAINVAQDDKVRELATMIHKGARRRGLFAADFPAAGAPAASTTPGGSPTAVVAPAKPSLPIPFAPSGAASGTGLFGVPGIDKYFTLNNAQKALGWAGVVKDLLVK